MFVVHERRGRNRLSRTIPVDVFDAVVVPVVVLGVGPFVRIDSFSVGKEIVADSRDPRCVLGGHLSGWRLLLGRVELYARVSKPGQLVLKYEDDKGFVFGVVQAVLFGSRAVELARSLQSSTP